MNWITPEEFAQRRHAVQTLHCNVCDKKHPTKPDRPYTGCRYGKSTGPAAEVKMLDLLQKNGPMGPADLCKRMGISRTSLNYVCKSLRRAGLINPIAHGGKYFILGVEKK